MIKKSILILSTITALHAHAMENNEPMEIEESTPFYIALLPIDMQDRIADFLTFDDIESEEEFITRTKTETTKKPKPYDKYMPKFEWGVGCAGTCFAYCPNEINIALLHLRSGAGATPSLTIINENKEQPLHEIPLENGNYRRHIPLSRGAHMFATVEEKNDTEEEIMSYQDILTIQEISSQKKQEFIIPDYFKYNLIAFKKEGTHIVLHGTDSRNNSNLSTEKNPHHMIIPVTVNEPHPEQKKKTLQHYFQQKLICKKITCDK